MFFDKKNNFVKIRQVTSKYWLFFLDLIFPIECLSCSQEGEWLCHDCFKKIKLKDKQYCLECKQENDFGQFCPNCQPDYALDGVWIATLYDEKIISQAIKSLKYHFVRGLADDLGKLLILFMGNIINQARIIKPDLAGGIDWRAFNRAKDVPLAILNFKACLVVPVPLAKKRLYWRGFNQSEILGKVLAKHYALELDSQNLIRTKHKKPQAKLSEVARKSNIKGCYFWQGGDLEKRNIILIDDVTTTGSTLNECAKVLKASGAGEVWGLVVAGGN